VVAGKLCLLRAEFSLQFELEFLLTASGRATNNYVNYVSWLEEDKLKEQRKEVSSDNVLVGRVREEKREEYFFYHTMD
jgi:hypothetical protein